MKSTAIWLVGWGLYTALLYAGEPQPLRTPWTSSKITGSPEPPLPYVVERAYPNLKFERPLDIEFCPGSERIFIAQQKGNFFSFPNDPNVSKTDVFFDRSQLEHLKSVPHCIGTDDALAFVFHPQFQKNRYCYIEYNLKYDFSKRNQPNGSRVSRFTVTDTDPPRIDAHSETIMLEWLSGGHNGCTLRFGPDGYLYISTGDGADPDPPDDMLTGQDISDLLASILRIDVDHPSGDKPYSIPKDNPFVNLAGARPEVFAYGLRNPFRMNFDSKSGLLWVGDVGWELYEMVHCVKSGGNYGWNIFEGPNPVNPTGKRGPTEISKPLAALTHAEAASITGGLVYRGAKLPELQGQYVFGDWQTKRMWSAKVIGEKQDGLEPYRDLAQTDLSIVAFVEDPQHEPLVLDHGGGGIYHLVRNPLAGQKSNFPRKLSETGLFASLDAQTPAPGVMPFEINAPQWNDGGRAQRWAAFPGDSKMSWGKGVWGDTKVAWPKDSVLARTVSLEMTTGDPASSKRVETQILQFDGRQWNGYTYAWNAEQTDAELVPAGGLEKAYLLKDPSVPGGARRQVWHYPSRTQCITCHNVWCDYALAFNDAQLDRESIFQTSAGERKLNQVAAFRQLGLLLKAKDDGDSSKEKSTLANPYDQTASVAERARTYLHVNCSCCHRFGGGGTALIDVRKDRTLKQLNAIDEAPRLGIFGIDGAKLICPGDPNRSVLIYRTSKLGRGRMPHICSDVVDERGTSLLRRWIGELKTDGPKTDIVKLDQVKELLSNTRGALTVLGAVQGDSVTGEFRQQIIDAALVSPLDTVRDLFRRYDPRELLAERLGANIGRSKLLAMNGDAARGRKVFFEIGGGLCSKCHKIDGQGTDFGPDFSHIGTKYDKAQLLENILEPSKTIAEGFTTYLVKRKNGEIINGLLVSKSDKEVVMRDIQKKYAIPADDIAKMQALPTSAMPEGQLNDLTAQEAADLLEFLRSLK